MQDAELAYAPAVEQARLVRDGHVSPVELVDLYLRRIERANPDLGAYLTVAEDHALRWAKEAEALAGDEDAPPFTGVPISIKDLNDTAGIRTTKGASAFRDRVPDDDDHVVARVKAAGFVILGKTNTPEFGKSAVTEPSGYPPCRNPWDLQRSPGGSSGGAGAALAAGLCAISQGSDGGGSIRMPSACCGVFGVKPSRGRVSSAPGFPALTSSPGPMARTVADAAALLDVLAGYETGDAYWAPPPERPFREEVGRDPGRLRVAFSLRPPIEAAAVAPSAVAATRRAADLLASLGHDVAERDPVYPDGLLFPGVALRAADVIANRELPDPDSLDQLTRFFYEAGRNLSARDYLLAVQDLQVACRGLVAFFDDVDVLLTPTIAIQPPFVGEFANVLEDPEAAARLRAMATFTMPWNNTGQPAVSIPFEIDDDGLPVGVQLVGRPADETTLIRVSAQLEEANPWAHRRPPNL